LFGGSILAGGDLIAAALEDRIVERFLVGGGKGHSTDALYDECGRTWAGTTSRASGGTRPKPAS
jgi:hypothetical protein